MSEEHRKTIRETVDAFAMLIVESEAEGTAELLKDRPPTEHAAIRAKSERERGLILRIECRSGDEGSNRDRNPSNCRGRNVC